MILLRFDASTSLFSVPILGAPDPSPDLLDTNRAFPPPGRPDGSALGSDPDAGDGKLSLQYVPDPVILHVSPRALPVVTVTGIMPHHYDLKTTPLLRGGHCRLDESTAAGRDCLYQGRERDTPVKLGHIVPLHAVSVG